MSICVIIPMYGLPDVTKNCIDYTIKNAGVEHDILVVDDCSPQPFQDDRVFIKRLEKNVGFTGATNAGIIWALEHKYDYVLLLNNDTEPEPDFMKILLDILQKNPEIGIAGSTRIIINDKGVPWIENFGIDLVMGYQAYTEKDLTEEIVYVVWIPTCSALIPTEVIRYVGLLDKRMRTYCSDNDYCVRMHQLGYNVVLIPKSKIKHFHQTTTKTLDYRYQDAERDQLILIEKLSCNIQKQMLETYPLDWDRRTWGKLEFTIYTKDKNPEFSDAVIEDNDKISQPTTT